MNTLDIKRYQFNCQCQTALQLNHYSGSMLRGAFGHALRALSCVTHMSECKQCMLYRQCSYPAIFETPVPEQTNFQKFNNIPRPYIIEPPEMGRVSLQKGELFCFNLVLIGQANSQLPLIILAWQRALANGLGSNKAKAKLHSITFEPQQAAEQIIYEAEQDKLLPTPVFKAQAIAPAEDIKIQTLSPLAILKNGRLLSNDMRAEDFLMALVRRYYLLLEFYAADYQPPDFSALAQLATKINAYADFQQYDWSRKSTRQQQRMTFKGVTGSLVLQGPLAPFLDIINLGQWIHVGKKSTFGMGRYVFA